jgi:hypothetical protein
MPNGRRRLVVAVAGMLSLVAVAASISAPSAGALIGGQSAAAVATPRSLVSVSCPTARFCIAVGEYSVASQDGGPPIDIPLAEHWNGSTWSIQDIVNPPNPLDGTGSSLGAVSCVSVKSCTAVGTSDGDVSLAEHWNGSSWAIQPMPGGVALLTGVSCVSATFCVAVGQSNHGVRGAPSILVERWNGSTWKLQPTARIVGLADGGLFSVSCSAANACTTVGTALVETAEVRVVERWNGHHWTRQKTPAFRVIATLTGISCSSAKSCTADGVVTTEQSLVEHWNGTRWAVQTPRHVLTGGEVSSTAYRLAAVTCRSATMCIAVGQKDTPSDQVLTLTERWNGTKWAVQRTPAGGHSSLISVSCGSAKSCVAVGAATIDAPVTESWNGTTWKVRKTPTIPV